VQWIAASLGGYITGRLRVRWSNVHTDEVFFRDTAHGFVTWAVSTLLTITFFVVLAAMVGHGSAHVAARAMYGFRNEGENRPGIESPMAYYSDTLFRGEHLNADQPSYDVRGEANRILVKGLRDEGLAEQDKAYLAQLVATRTGIAEGDARARVDMV